MLKLVLQTRSTATHCTHTGRMHTADIRRLISAPDKDIVRLIETDLINQMAMVDTINLVDVGMEVGIYFVEIGLSSSDKLASSGNKAEELVYFGRAIARTLVRPLA